MTRGNQRDMARAKAAKKDKGSTKAANEQKGNEGLSKEQRMQRDADRMREKQKAKEAAAQAGAAGGKKWYTFHQTFPRNLMYRLCIYVLLFSRFLRKLATSDIPCQNFLGPDKGQDLPLIIWTKYHNMALVFFTALKRLEVVKQWI